MTNGEKLEQIFPDGICPFSKSWLDSEFKEPTTKNDHHKQNIEAFAHDFGVSEEQAEKELRVTTKNDLGVDCISRQSVLDKIQRLIDAEQNNIDENGDYMNYARERVNAYEGIQFFVENDCLCPSATPQEPTTKNDLAVDVDELISDCEKMSFDIDFFNKPLKVVALDAVKNIVKDLSSVTPQEPQTFKWCTDCREYGQDKHCCHRWSKVIRDTVKEMKQEQEPRKGMRWIGRFETHEWGKEEWCECPWCHMDSAEAYNFCPNCGADFREVEE